MLHLFLQYTRFGTVGLAATVTHVVMFTASIELAGLRPLIANLAAFAVAVLVGFVGHFHWTFRDHPGRRERRQSLLLIRFVVVALTGLALNSLVVYLVVDVAHLPYPYAIAVMVLFVPIPIFALNRLWAFA